MYVDPTPAHETDREPVQSVVEQKPQDKLGGSAGWMGSAVRMEPTSWDGGAIIINRGPIEVRINRPIFFLGSV